jgi:DNA recombination protein RmuC
MVFVMLVMGLVLGLLLGAAAGWVLAQRRLAEAHAAALESAVKVARAEETGRAHEVMSLQQRAVVEQVRRQEAEARSAVQAELSAALASVDELREAVESSRQQHAEYVSQHRREQAQREQQEAGQAQVLQTLTPVAQQLQAMQQKVAEMEQQRAAQHGQLAEQIRHTRSSVEESRKAADMLAAALSNNAVRGVWGETQLRTLVESAGLLAHVDFATQRSIEADSGARRPDMVISLPGGKQMAVDAKVPYSSFIDAQRTGIEPAERDRLLTEHARKVRGHVDTLAGKAYWTGLEASPEFTVAYIPNDQLLAAAIDSDPSLMDYAFGRGIVLATPTNLWSILKTVAFTWRQDVLTEDAKHLFDLGRELYRRIITLAEHAERLRRSIESTVSNYNKFASSLESRVLVTARKLDALDEEKVLGTAPAAIEQRPTQLTADDFPVHEAGIDELSLFADLERPELDLTAVDAEIVDEVEGRGEAV